AAREKLGISQTQLAEMLDPSLRVSKVAIGHYETGRSLPDRDRGAAIAKILKISPKKIPTSDRTPRKPVKIATKSRSRVARSASSAPQRGKTKVDGGLLLTNPDEISIINALRGMTAATRRVVRTMILAATTG
ncbi:MAG: multiprotein-bridging factor 1 family protein, partial [Alphaproteobacteria bacterium]